MTCFSIVRFENSILRRSTSASMSQENFPLHSCSNEIQIPGLAQGRLSLPSPKPLKSGTLASRRLASALHLLPATATGQRIKQGTQACVCPLGERAQTETEYSNGANFQRDGRAAHGEWRGSRTDSYPKLFRSIASNILPEPPRAPRHSSLRGMRRSFLYTECAVITRRKEPRPGRGGETSLGAENVNLICSQFPFRQPRPVRGEEK